MPNDSSFSIGKIKSFVDKFFKLFGNFIDGYDVKSSDVAKESGGVRFSTVMQSENGPLRIDLIATNVGTAFKDTKNVIQNLDLSALTVGMNIEDEEDADDYSDKISQELRDFDAASTNINAASYKDAKQVVEELRTLLGKDCLKEVDTPHGKDYEGDISLESATKRNINGGMLGINLKEIIKNNALKSDAFKLWSRKAFYEMKYTLICEAGNNDAGKVTNIKLEDCATYIDKYLAIINNITTEGEQKQATRKDKTEKAKNKKTIGLMLVIPILHVIQEELKKMYQNKLNSDTSLDKLIPGNEPAEDEQLEEYDEEALKNMEDARNAQQQQAAASQHINITLKKIQASDELDILRLESNYSPSDTLSDIDEIINQDEFLNTLTEEPQAFAIEVDDEGFDIEKCDECPECSPCESLCEVFKAGIRAYRNLYILHWMSHGNDMMKLHNLSEEMYEELQSEIDTIGELLVEKQGTVPQLDFDCDYIPVQQYDFQTGLDQIKSLIQMYIDCIDYAYCNQDSDVQSTLDEWLRYWNKQINYFIKNQEEV